MTSAIREAAALIEAERAAGDARRAAVAAERDRALAACDAVIGHERDEAASAEEAAREAFRVAVDAIHRAERASQVAQRDTAQFRATHAMRSDVAGLALDRALDLLPAALEVELERLRRDLCDPVRSVSPDDLARVGGLIAASDPAFGEQLRELVGAGRFSALSGEQVSERLAAAREQRERVDAAIRDGRAATRAIGAVVKGESDADPTAAAAAALEANSRAQAALQKMRAVLYPITED